MSADQELSGFDGDEGNTVVGDTTLPPSDSDTAEIVRGDPADRDDWTRNAAAENDGGGADPVDRTDSPDPISEAIENFGNTAANLQRFYQERLDNIRIREAERTDVGALLLISCTSPINVAHTMISKGQKATNFESSLIVTSIIFHMWCSDKILTNFVRVYIGI